MARRITLPKDKLLRQLRLAKAKDREDEYAAALKAAEEAELKRNEEELAALFSGETAPQAEPVETTAFQRLLQRARDRNPNVTMPTPPAPSIGIVRRNSIRDRERMAADQRVVNIYIDEEESNDQYTIAQLRSMSRGELLEAASLVEAKFEERGDTPTMPRPRSMASVIRYILTLQSDLVTSEPEEEEDIREQHFLRRSLRDMNSAQLTAVVEATIARTGCPPPPRYRHARDYIGWVIQEQRNEIDRLNDT